MKLTRALPTQPHRDAWLAINLQALETNIATIRQHLPRHVAQMAIVKADAYGHGAVMCLPTLLGAGISQLGVASIDEALQIREAGFGDIPILVVGPTPSWAFQAALSHNIQLTIFDDGQRQQLAAVAQQLGKVAVIHIKVDTGMHRIGVEWHQAEALIQGCQQSPHLHLAGVFSHLANTDDNDLTYRQHQRFQSVLASLTNKPPHCHLMNSSGALNHPDLIDGQQTMVRLGLAMWGYSSKFIGDNASPSLELQPVMSLKARIVHVQTVQPGEGVSYNHTMRVPEGQPRRIATLPIGYGDGIPRRLSNQLTVTVMANDQLVGCPQVGTITMDQLMIDITAAPEVGLGDTVTFFGPRGDGNSPTATLTTWASQLDTIEYELMCALRVRLPRTYIRE